jgi:hypothetical protein
MPAETARVAPSAAADIMLRALTDSAPGDRERATLIADTVGLLEEARRLCEDALEAGLDPATAAGCCTAWPRRTGTAGATRSRCATPTRRSRCLGCRRRCSEVEIPLQQFRNQGLDGATDCVDSIR